jgi:hypothetical protein
MLFSMPAIALPGYESSGHSNWNTREATLLRSW